MERELTLTLRITEDCYEADFFDYNSGDSVQYSFLKTEPWESGMGKAVSQEILSWFEIMEDLQEDE